MNRQEEKENRNCIEFQINQKKKERDTWRKEHKFQAYKRKKSFKRR